ncbi:MAG: asparagine synthetase B family protein [Candidatus Binataceae bacterium]
MSGIFGVWNLDGTPIDAAAFNRSLAQMAHRGPDGAEVWLQGAVGLGCQISRTVPESADEHQPVTFGELACVFDGRLDNRAELATALSDHPLCNPECPDSHLVLAAYDRLGDEFVSRLEGDFALAIFDGHRRRMILVRDRVGLRPLCYAQSGQTFLFASDAKSILAYPGIGAAPDEETLADFILYFPSAEAQTRTFFRGVRSLQPAHFAVLADGDLNVRRYFDFDTSRPLRLANFDEYAQAFRELFERSVRRRLRSRYPVAISVSGGLDSSYIFCLADKMAGNHDGLAPEVFGLNYGGPVGTASDEREYVEELKKVCSAPIEHLEQRPGFIATAAEDAWSSESADVDGQGSTEHALKERARKHGARLLLTGHWGDQLLISWTYLLDLLRQGRWHLFRAHRDAWNQRAANITAAALAQSFLRDQLERLGPPPLLSLSRRVRARFDGPWNAPWFTPRFRQLLIARFTAERLPRIDGSTHAWSTYQECRRSYFVHCMEWQTRVGALHGLEMALPFLDREVIQFLTNIPGEIQAHEGRPRNLMRGAMRGIVPDAIVNRRTKGEFTHLGNEGIERDFDAIRNLLGPGALAVEMGYFNGPVLWKHLEDWRQANRVSDDSVIAWRITDLCGFELLLRRFFG